jgi:DNA-binding NarL/FixJ family response regulator
VSSKPGTLWRDSETLRGAQREQLEVLRELDGAGLGEGAGYKLLERPSPSYGVEHFMLALLMERGERFPPRSKVMLAALHKHIRAAVLRLSLPLLSHQPLHPQMVAEQSLGYICLSLNGRVLEANQRARHLVDLYRGVAGVQELRRAVEDFAERARKLAVGGRPWQLRIDGSTSFLLVDAHHLDKETHVLSEDTILLSMREVQAPQVVARAQPALERLTTREQQVALLLASTGDSWKQIADKLKLSLHTVRTHKFNIYKKLGVGTRQQLMVLLTK